NNPRGGEYMVSQPGSLQVPRADIAGRKDAQSQPEATQEMNESHRCKFAQEPAGGQRYSQQREPTANFAEFRRQRWIARAEDQSDKWNYEQHGHAKQSERQLPG